MRRPPPQHENHERWLVSYADFVTLLFALFVMMFSSTQSDKNKAKQVSEAVRDALEHGELSSAISVVLGRGKHMSNKTPPVPNPADAGEFQGVKTPPAANAQPADLVQSLATLQQGLAGELKKGSLQVSLEGRGLVISLREAAFFGSGDDAIAPDSLPVIAKIAAVVRDVGNPLRLEGYTDSMPIHNSRFHSNWELSAARSIAMLQLLKTNFQVPPERMSVAGYAENAPVESNDTAEGRARNRRVELVLLSAEAMKVEQRNAPAPAPAPAATPAK
jgi:chemotaxis protein MotB